MNVDAPTYAQIRALHKKYAPTATAYDSVFTHCQIIWEIAQQLIEKSNLSVDREFVKAGCLLHDIGVYALYRPSGEIDRKSYIKHGILGHALLEKEGFSERFCRVASCHTGVGLSRQSIKEQSLSLPDKDFIAQSVEERLVMYADKFHSKSTPPRLNSIESYRVFTAKFGLENVELFNMFEQEFGAPDLAPLAQMYHLEIV